MLDETEQVIKRLHSFSQSSRAAKQLTGLHDYCRRDLQRIVSTLDYPHVMRILAEECIEQLQSIIDNLVAGSEGEELSDYPYWRSYLHGISTRQLYDLELIRYRSAKKLADLFLQDSYLCEHETEYKKARYAYAMLNAPLPDWYCPDAVAGWLEEIMTAYCLLWFAVMDYAEEHSQAACA